MEFTIDQTAEWTEFYVAHGYAHLTGVFGDEFIRPAMRAVRAILGHELPPEEWTKQNTAQSHIPRDARFAVLDQIYDQPGIRKMIDAMFSPTDSWNGERMYQLFVNPFDAAAPRTISDRGHIDFVEGPIPILGSGFMFQASLVRSEPYSGNLTVYPGSLARMQALLRENPDRRFPTDPALCEALVCPPVEFVAEPGDVMLFHHLIGHNGNVSHADGRSPRCVLHCQGLRHKWPRELDPASGVLSPWERSVLPQGKRYRPVVEELEAINAWRESRRRKPA